MFKSFLTAVAVFTVASGVEVESAYGSYGPANLGILFGRAKRPGYGAKVDPLYNDYGIKNDYSAGLGGSYSRGYSSGAYKSGKSKTGYGRSYGGAYGGSYGGSYGKLGGYSGYGAYSPAAPAKPAKALGYRIAAPIKPGGIARPAGPTGPHGGYTVLRGPRGVAAPITPLRPGGIRGTK